MANIMVVLTGCGRMDGSEIHESTLSLLYLAQGGADYQCFAPDEDQVSVINHMNDETQDEERNQMVEASRIARGDIKPLSEADPAAFDGLLIPGGNGAFANLGQGPGDVHPDVRRLLVAMADAKKPIAAICIAPVLVARALGDRGVELTIGDDPDTAAIVEAAGAKHVECPVDRCVRDEAHRIVTTPAYMLGPGIADVAKGIREAVEVLLEWCG